MVTHPVTNIRTLKFGWNWNLLDPHGSALQRSFCKTDSHSFCNKTTFLRVIPTMAHINTYYININCHEYLKIPETYSDILYDILSDIPSGTLIWHSIWHSAWHSISHWFPADILSGILSGITIWHSIWHSIRHSVWHSI